MKKVDQIIIELLKSGDEKAYKYVYDHHYILLCKIAKEFLKDDFLAETIVGDAIFHLWEVRNKIEISSSLRCYLVKMVRNRCINHLNLKYVKMEGTLPSSNSDDFWSDNYFISKDNPLGALLEEELEQEMYDSIERLPEECQVVFKKSRFEEKKYQDIADELGITVNTVKYHIKNALKRLEADLCKYMATLIILFVR
jgi:RNA polymerase sigma-70 factor (ECF subfamily)